MVTLNRSRRWALAMKLRNPLAGIAFCARSSAGGVAPTRDIKAHARLALPVMIELSRTLRRGR